MLNVTRSTEWHDIDSFHLGNIMAEQTEADAIEQEIQTRLRTMRGEREKLQIEYDRMKAENDRRRADPRMGTGAAPALGANGVWIFNRAGRHSDMGSDRGNPPG